MQVIQHRWSGGAWRPALGPPNAAPQLLLVFGSPSLVEDRARLAELAGAYPAALRVGCSTAGEIYGALGGSPA